MTQTLSTTDDLKRALMVHDVIDILNADGSVYLTIKGGHGSNPETVRYQRFPRMGGRIMTASVKQLFTLVEGKQIA